MYATEGRMWLALTGHAQDASRLFPPEFELLSIIASRRENGLIQSDLVRLSGQDKRTVPKRTDALREKGYIEKRPVLVKKQRTSLLTLCKFLPAADQPRYPLERGQPNTAAVERQDTLESIEHSGKIVTYDELDEVVDVQALLLSLFSVLKEQNLIAMRDLKQKLGFQLSGPCKVLSRTIRKMESIGCVKRVRAASEYTARLGFHHPSLKLLRSPTEADLRRFGAESLSAHVFGAAETENDDDSSFEGPAPNLDATNTIGESSLLEISQVVPQWTPDRNLANMLFTIVDSAGSLGVNNKVSASLTSTLQHHVDPLVVHSKCSLRSAFQASDRESCRQARCTLATISTASSPPFVAHTRYSHGWTPNLLCSLHIPKL